jgi:phosphohistidine phosphatase SixA
MTRLRLPILLVSLFVFLSAPAAPLEVVYVVRHAQKVGDWDADSRLKPLSPKGARCAEKLAGLLEDREIAAVYSTEFARTLATGAAVSGAFPDAEVIGDDATVMPSREWADELRERHRDDEAILLVGHSNTVDDLVLAFRPDAGSCFEQLRLKTPKIPETQYGDVWRLELGEQEGCGGVTVEEIGRVDGEDCSTP